MNTFAHIFHVCFSCWECFRIESSHVTHHQSGRSSVVFLPYFVGKRHFFCKYFCVQIKKQHNSIAGAFPHGNKYKNNNIFYTNTFMHMCCFFLLVKSPFACVFITSFCLVYWEKNDSINSMCYFVCCTNISTRPLRVEVFFTLFYINFHSFFCNAFVYRLFWMKRCKNLQ